MTTLEIIRRLVAEPSDPQSEAIKQAVLALFEALLEKEEPKTAKKEPAKKSPGGGGEETGKKTV